MKKITPALALVAALWGGDPAGANDSPGSALFEAAHASDPYVETARDIIF